MKSSEWRVDYGKEERYTFLAKRALKKFTRSLGIEKKKIEGTQISYPQVGRCCLLRIMRRKKAWKKFGSVQVENTKDEVV